MMGRNNQREGSRVTLTVPLGAESVDRRTGTTATRET